MRRTLPDPADPRDDWRRSLKRRRIKAELTREELAAFVGLNPRTISSYEVGWRLPSLHSMRAIDAALASHATVDQTADILDRIAALEAAIASLTAKSAA